MSLDRAEEGDQDDGLDPQMGMTASQIKLTLTIDLAAIIQMLNKWSGIKVKPPDDWITVTEAAKRMIDLEVVPKIDPEKAKARISKACGSQIKCAGKGNFRRIDPGSLSIWLLDQRKKDLDKAG